MNVLLNVTDGPSCKKTIHIYISQCPINKELNNGLNKIFFKGEVSVLNPSKNWIEGCSRILWSKLWVCFKFWVVYCRLQKGLLYLKTQTRPEIRVGRHYRQHTYKYQTLHIYSWSHRHTHTNWEDILSCFTHSTTFCANGIISGKWYQGLRTRTGKIW